MCGLLVQVGSSISFTLTAGLHVFLSRFTGQDNTNALCEIGAVPNIFEGDEDDHSGPYDGITMGC